MYKKVITYNPFDLFSIRKAQKEVDEYREWVLEKAHQLCKRLAEIGLQVAQIYFIPEAWNGNADVTLSIEPLNDGYLVRADGEDVCFLEFGTGVTAGLGYDSNVLEPPVDISPGSWSHTAGSGKFAEDGYWYYNGQRLDGTIPQMGLNLAASEVKQRFAQVAKEVFGS